MARDPSPSRRTPSLDRRTPRAIARARASLIAALLAAGCSGGTGGSGTQVDAGIDGPVGPAWWQPKVGEAKNWDIQLSAASGAVDVTAPRLMYDLDLWALVPAQTTIDYGDGAPVTVPAGALATTIAQLHARTPRTIVICHVETGVLEMARPDARKFPAAAVGMPVPGMTGTRFLDISDAGRAKWSAIMFKRLDLAKQIGCDGIEPSHNDVAAYGSGSGFTISATESFSWYTEIATQGHMRMLSTGMKDGDVVPAGQVDVEADKFDWLMTERCGEFMYCDAARPFITLGKAVFAIDYNMNSDGNPQGSTIVCMMQGIAMIADGLYKDVALSKAVRTQCEP